MPSKNDSECDLSIVKEIRYNHFVMYSKIGRELYGPEYSDVFITMSGERILQCQDS